MALMRRQRVFRAVGCLGCWLIGVRSGDDVDQATLDAYIAALAERDVSPRLSHDEPAEGALDAAA